MAELPSRTMRHAVLEKLNAQLDKSLDMADIRFERACLLTELGAIEEAKSDYLALLTADPTHFGALNNLGNLLYTTGFISAARTAYTQAVLHHPDNPKGYVNLANLLAANNEPELAMQHFEVALSLDPEHHEAHQGLAYLLTELRDEEKAALHRKKGFQHRPVQLLPYTGEGPPISLLLLVSARGGTIPMRHHFNDRIFLVSVLFVEFYDHTVPLPPHQLVVNAIGDADLCKPALEATIDILAKTTAPVINQPIHVLRTGRRENAQRLGAIPGVITPKTLLLPRALLEDANAPSMLAKQEVSFPLLLRAPGFHTGRHFVRVDKASELAAHVAALPGKDLLAIQYLDARGRDGKIRKYRVMIIDGVVYPLHLAISHEWKIHYFTAEMAENPEHRAEDEAFLNNMPQMLGARAMQALQSIAEVLSLEYCGIDFSVNEDGAILLFEANATMVVYPPDKDARWDYRRPAVERILNAIRQLLTQHAH